MLRLLQQGSWFRSGARILAPFPWCYTRAAPSQLPIMQAHQFLPSLLLLLAPFPETLLAQGESQASSELQAPFQLLCGDQPLDVGDDIGYAAPFLADMDGDDLKSMGKIHVYSGRTGCEIHSIAGVVVEVNNVPITSGKRMGSRIDNTANSIQVTFTGDTPSNEIWVDLPLFISNIRSTSVGDIDYGEGRVIMPASTVSVTITFGTVNKPLPLTADAYNMSVSTASTQNLILEAGIGSAKMDYWIFTNFAASGNSPGVAFAPGVILPLNPDVLANLVASVTQLGGDGTTFVDWKGTLDNSGKAKASLNTLGPVPALVGVTINHAALVYSSNGCGPGCDTFSLATNVVSVTTQP